ncbi:AlbA family DNA-binding domain-containing protein [Adhaeribacter aquaticus]|uniref:AlbA family DNA-binding domain-containing protein n=1 Tax=Adhaeribacter aquaticus TaxID=299567 RepID=UPI00040B8F38|nr:ATP-binding protein [Adhaeribacter aquaticus]
MEELEKLIATGEGDKLEFKKTINQLVKIARTITSFANSRGGIILVGVMDNGTISGIDPEEEKHSLTKAAELYCNPPVKLFFKEIEVEDKIVLKTIIFESKNKPHFAKVKEGDWRAYIRVKDESVQTDKWLI